MFGPLRSVFRSAHAPLTCSDAGSGFPNRCMPYEFENLTNSDGDYSLLLAQQPLPSAGRMQSVRTELQVLTEQSELQMTFEVRTVDIVIISASTWSIFYCFSVSASTFAIQLYNHECIAYQMIPCTSQDNSCNSRICSYPAEGLVKCDIYIMPTIEHPRKQ